MCLSKMFRYNVEIDVSGDDVTHLVGRGYWLCTDILVTQGETLQECIDNATISTQNQDGGAGPDISLCDMSAKNIDYYAKLIEHELNVQLDKEGYNE